MKNIYVGNLNSKTTAESLRSFFQRFGTIHKLKLMSDRDTSLSRGFAFIEMNEPEADKAIVALNGQVLDGSAIDVHEGRPKLNRPAPPKQEPGEAALTDAAPRETKHQ